MIFSRVYCTVLIIVHVALECYQCNRLRKALCADMAKTHIFLLRSSDQITFYLRRSRKVYESRFFFSFSFLTHVKIMTLCDHMWPLWQVCPHVTTVNTPDKCDHISLVSSHVTRVTTSWTIGHHGHLDIMDIKTSWTFGHHGHLDITDIWTSRTFGHHGHLNITKENIWKFFLFCY